MKIFAWIILGINLIIIVLMFLYLVCGKTIINRLVKRNKKDKKKML